VQQTLATRPVPYYRGAPEAAFGLTPVTTRANTAQASMSPGPWLLNQHNGRLHQGCIGVLVDDVTAYAALTGRSEDQWGVSSAISVDFHSSLPAGTERLAATATLDHRSAGWAHSSGRITTEAGELVATIGQRMRYLSGSSAVHERPGEPEGPPSWLPSLDSLLRLTSQRGNRTELHLEALPGMSNPLGMVHGGVGLCVSEVAARTAWSSFPDHSGEPFHTAAIRISYLRPGRLDGDLTLNVEILHASRSVVLAEVRMNNADGKTATLAHSTLHHSATAL